MWSKTRKALNDRLADCLKNRVNYNFMVYTSTPYKWCTEMPVFYIHVDKKTWFASNPMFYSAAGEYMNEHMNYDLSGDEYWQEYYAKDRDAGLYAIRETGMVDIYKLMSRIHIYINEINIHDAINGDDYFYRMLAIMDRRIGKRSIKKLLDNIENEPLWIKKYIYLRAGAEGLIPTIDSQTLLKTERIQKNDSTN